MKEYNMPNLSPLAQARQAAMRDFAENLRDLSTAFLEDLANPENQDEEAFTGKEWLGLCFMLAKVGRGIPAQIAAVITTEV
jgi:hypothetical protein